MSRKQNPSPKEPPISIYLGQSADKERRIQSLDKLAEERGISRSLLIQLIADGVIPLGDVDGSPPRYVQTYEPQRTPA